MCNAYHVERELTESILETSDVPARLRFKKRSTLVGDPGLEPGTPASQTRCANQLRQSPRVVREGLEPTRAFAHMILSHARIPIPPPDQKNFSTSILPKTAVRLEVKDFEP